MLVVRGHGRKAGAQRVGDQMALGGRGGVRRRAHGGAGGTGVAGGELRDEEEGNEAEGRR